MTTPVVEDPAETVINAFTNALRAAFNPADTIQPPLGGGSTVVRFIAGEGPALELWDALSCNEPFLWVRLMRRFRFKDFPEPITDTTSCGALLAAAIEVGIGRCVSISADGTVDWVKVAAEGEVARDDSWRIDKALCSAARLLRVKRQVGIGTVDPIGPEGGVIGWAGTAVVQL